MHVKPDRATSLAPSSRRRESKERLTLIKNILKNIFPRFIDTEIVEKDGFFDIFYLLEEPGAYDVDVKFGGKQVPNGLMRMTVK